MTWQKDERFDKLDVLIGLSMKDYADEDTEQCMNADVSAVTFSDDYYRRKKRVINRYVVRQNLAAARKVASKVAIVVLCLLSAAFITVMSVSALRNALWNTIIEWYDEYLVVRFEPNDKNDGPTQSDNSDNNRVPTKIEKFKKPQYIPEGVEEEIVAQSVVMNVIDYYKGDELQYTFKQQLLKARDEIINNENSTVTEIMINGRSGMSFESSESEELIIVWDDGEYMYLLSSYLDIEESLKIAESVASENDDKTSVTPPTEILEYRKPTYTPKGVEAVVVNQDTLVYIVDYYIGDELQYTYRQSPLSNNSMKVNNDNSTVNIVYINGTEVYVIESDNNEELLLVWTDGKYKYSITSYLELAETIKIAESVAPENDDKTAVPPPTKILEYIKPTYVPKGFEAEEILKSKGAYCIEYYLDDVLQCAYFQRVLNEDSKKINNENCITYQVKIKEKNATVIENKSDKHLTLIWTDGRYIYYFSSYISLEETLKMAESLEDELVPTDKDVSAGSPPTVILEYRKPQYVPEGVEEEIVIQSIGNYIIDYYLGDRLRCSYKQGLLNRESTYVNNENSIIYTIDINGYTANVIESKENEELTIIWNDERYSYIITSYFNLEDTVIIAKSIG